MKSKRRRRPWLLVGCCVAPSQEEARPVVPAAQRCGAPSSRRIAETLLPALLLCPLNLVAHVKLLLQRQPRFAGKEEPSPRLWRDCIERPVGHRGKV